MRGHGCKLKRLLRQAVEAYLEEPTWARAAQRTHIARSTFCVWIKRLQSIFLDRGGDGKKDRPGIVRAFSSAILKARDSLSMGGESIDNLPAAPFEQGKVRVDQDGRSGPDEVLEAVGTG